MRCAITRLDRFLRLTLVVLCVARAGSGGQSDQLRSSAANVKTERLDNGIVRVTFDLNGSPDATYSVALEASNDGGSTFAIRPAATRGDVGQNVRAGVGKVIEWDSSKDTDDLQPERFVFRILTTSATAPSARALRIVVLEGENAVNSIRQKGASPPIVEVRDGNDLPVSGATVIFGIAGGRNATFAGGATTLAVTTNASGRAVATGFNPQGSGAVQISVDASFQGQVAHATIQQTNVAQPVTAPGQARKVGGGSVGQAGGGGLSGKTIGLIAGGAAAGAGIAIAKGKSGGPSPTAVLVITVSPNPVLAQGFGTNGDCRQYQWTTTFTETAGAAVRMTKLTEIVDGQQDPFDLDSVSILNITARGSLTLMPGQTLANGSWIFCLSINGAFTAHTIQRIYQGTDEFGHPITATSPVLSLLAP